MQLKDKVVITTGGCQGLDRAVGEYLAGKGARLTLVGLNHGRLDEAVAAYKAAGGDACAYVCNVTDEEQVAHMVAQVASDFGVVSGLVSNAGILRGGLTIGVKDGQLNKMSLAQWQSMIDVNLTGVLLCTHEMVAKMIELKNESAAVNISSIPRADNMGQASYSATKVGATADTAIWTKELTRYGIHVTGVTPGFIETGMTAGMEPEALEKMTAGIPLKRMNKPMEIAHSVAYIFGNDYYTDHVLELGSGLRL